MAYNSTLLSYVLPYMQVAESNLFLGYPDIVVPLEEAKRAFPDVDIRPGVMTGSWVNKDGTSTPPFMLANSDDLLDKLKVMDRTYLDVNAHRDCEIYVDLNVPTKLTRQWGAVHDLGTLEHLANPWQGIQFMYDHTLVGGHITILQGFGTKKNHGFFEIQPNFFIDLEKCNKDSLQLRRGIALANGELVCITPTEMPVMFVKQCLVGVTSVFYLIVYKKTAEGKLKLPIQTRYSIKATTPTY